MIRRLLLLFLAPLGALLLVGTILRVLAPVPVSAAGGDVYCVVPPGAPAGPFAACAAVYDDPQAAADGAPAGAEIRLAAGTYTQVHDLSGLRQLLLLERDVELSGGWLPPFDAPPDPAANPTVLDAGYGGRVVYISGPVAVSITGVTLQRGDATGLGGFGESIPDDAGGGLYADGAALFLSDSVISDNRAVNDSVPLAAGYGGGLFVANGHVELERNLIAHNVAAAGDGHGKGGGLALRNTTGTIANNQVRDNIAALSHGGVGGGAALANEFSTPVAGQAITIANNVIDGNVGSLGNLMGAGGGLMVELWDYATVTVSGNLLRANTATIGTTLNPFGGGLAAGVYGNSSLLVENNDILSNTVAVSGHVATGAGAAILNYSDGDLSPGQVTMRSNRLHGNYVGPLTAAGCSALDIVGAVELTGNLIAFNRSEALDQLGTVCVYRNPLPMINNVLLKNETLFGSPGLDLSGNENTPLRLAHTSLIANAGGDGTALSISDWASARFALTNTLVVSHAVGILARGGTTTTLNGVLWHNVPVTASVSPTATFAISNQVVGDPRLGPDGYHLQGGSAAINRGVPAGVPFDIDGDPRQGPPDLGADEWHGFQIWLPVARRP